ncbi:MAG: tyrosine-type recombinase/integrase, partial [Burkholderiaceae bacterium]
MASIEKRVNDDGSTSYRVKVRLRGYEPVTATFTRLTDAKNWATQTESDLKANRYFGASKRHTVSELITAYRKDALPKLKSARSVSKRPDFWNERIGKLLLSDLQTSKIKELRDELKATPKARGTAARSPADVNRYLAALSSVLTYAVKELEWLDDNPMRRVTKLSEPSGRVRYLTEDELPKLLKACEDSKNTDLLLAVLLALSTGARQSEVMGLRWPQIDLKKRTALLVDTKNGERRILPIVGKALDLLNERAKIRRIDDDRLFPAGPRAKNP